MPLNGNLPEEELIKNLNLRNPLIAGLLTWLVPGLGHYYQGRTAKAVLFFVCIVPIFLAGCVLGSNGEAGIARNVYCSWRLQDRRYFFIPQAFLGLAAVPAGVQALQLRNGQPPFLGSFMAAGKLALKDRTGAAPTIQKIQQSLPWFEMGTYLTAIAGLMNLIVLFDAIDGPQLLPKRKEDSAL
ncbi:MAG: hypothetical protein LBT89_04325 [Planctomycetaceae bacterium]|jgi:hypothetical protein|nr:hypothetical protein [Planctomycetaceae bacterium]